MNDSVGKLNIMTVYIFACFKGHTKGAFHTWSADVVTVIWTH